MVKSHEFVDEGFKTNFTVMEPIYVQFGEKYSEIVKNSVAGKFRLVIYLSLLFRHIIDF